MKKSDPLLLFLEPSIMSALTESFSARLRVFYEHEGIAVSRFSCPQRAGCEQAARPHFLSHGAEAFLGAQYGEKTRVVVIVLDAEGKSEEAQGRNPRWHGGEDALPTYLQGTLRLLRKLLAKDLGDASPLPYFAVIHAAKCSFRDGGAEAVPDALYHACRPFAKLELTLLQPDIIVTQGEPAQRILDEDFPEREIDIAGLLAPANAIGQVPVFDWLTMDWLATVAARYLTCVRVAGRNVFALHTPRPGGEMWRMFEQLHLPICAWLLRELLGRKSA